MAWAFPLAVLAMAAAEFWVWAEAADLLGGWAVVGLTLISVLAGSALLRRVGLRAALELRARMERGEPPGPALFDGLCLTIAALLLMLPGLISDALALLLLLPAVRVALLRAVSARFGTAPPSGNGPTVIDGEYEIISPDHAAAPPSEHKRLEP